MMHLTVGEIAEPFLEAAVATDLVWVEAFANGRQLWRECGVLLWSPLPVLRERVRVRVILEFRETLVLEITLTPTLSRRTGRGGQREALDHAQCFYAIREQLVDQRHVHRAGDAGLAALAIASHERVLRRHRWVRHEMSVAIFDEPVKTKLGGGFHDGPSEVAQPIAVECEEIVF